MGHQFSSTYKQQGAVLVVALIFLVVLTVAGVTAMRFATSEERMAGNVQFRNQAFQFSLSELRAQLLSINQNLANRAPLLVAMSNPYVANDAAILKILPDGTREPSNLTKKMPRNIQVSQVRQSGTAGICTDSVNSGSNADIEGGFKCVEFEMTAMAAFDASCPDFKCSPNSSQAMGISFVNN